MTNVVTVCGEVAPEDLGRVLLHEHVFCALAGADLDARSVLDEDAAVEKATAWLSAVKEFGVGTVVDATPITWYRRPDILKRVSEATEVNIVASTGMYTERMGWPFHFKLMSVDELAEVFALEITEGSAGTDIRAGIVKLATGETIGKYEAKALEAACRIQDELGVGIITHTEGTRGGHAQLEAFQAVGADLDRILIGHVDNSTDTSYHRSLIEAGATIGFDRCGHYLITPDKERLDALRALAMDGLHDRIVLSHDAVASYIGKFFETPELPRWDEYGFTYIFQEIEPALEAAGVPPEATEAMTSANPRRILAA